jgi:hypothetical protein
MCQVNAFAGLTALLLAEAGRGPSGGVFAIPLQDLPPLPHEERLFQSAHPGGALGEERGDGPGGR